MTDRVHTGSRERQRYFDVEPRPQRITEGGIVLLVGKPPGDLHGEYQATWRVEGPVVLTDAQARIALLGAATVPQNNIIFDDTKPPIEIRATLDTTGLSVGSWTVFLELEPVGTGIERPAACGESDPIEIAQPPLAAGDDVSVTLRRPTPPPTDDQTLWVAIRNSTNALGYDRYVDFVDRVGCQERGSWDGFRGGHSRSHIALPFPGVERYRLLKATTEAFVMIYCRTFREVFRNVDVAEESARLDRTVDVAELEREFRRYLVDVPDGRGGELDVLPYLGIIRRKLGDVAVVGRDDDHERTDLCFGILAEKLTRPVLIELIWSYWMERAGLVRTLDAINWRFQNRPPAYPGRDPLASMEVEPLRPLSSLLWGIQRDQGHLLTAEQRNLEYAHAYGTQIAQPSRRVADNRNRFMAAFHNLLSECLDFYEQSDNTVIIPNAFNVLNGLKETHLLLTQGAANLYGEMPSATRQEMLMQQYLLGRPEVREFLPSRIMVDLPEGWMDAVDVMNRIQGWSDVSAMHYRDLAVFGEQLLLSIRFGEWPGVSNADQAAHWATYFRQEVQQYCHSLGAVQGHAPRRSPARPANGYATRQPSYQAFRG
ncbi:hypothetical protein ACFQS1_37515 [Paractinoplanes rhizophilus]|uniref:Uncharacterized protein n=1 Tax=Paractinoplanes rhizophilus TaxID=1416877 RepID=A0ABW2I4C9_9ACTN